MNRINPLYIILFLLLLLFLLVYKNASIKSKIQNQQKLNSKILSQAKEIDSLKRAFKNRKRDKTTFKSILSHPHIKRFVTQQSITDKKLSAKLDNLNKRAFDALSSKLFNSTLKIDSFSFKRLNEHNISVEFGVAL